MPHNTEKAVKAETATMSSVRRPSSLSSHALRGMMMISATRKAVAIQVPSVPVAPISPWIVGSAELTIEMSSVASIAPSAPAATAIQAVASAFSTGGETAAAAPAIGQSPAALRIESSWSLAARVSTLATTDMPGTSRRRISGEA